MCTYEVTTGIDDIIVLDDLERPVFYEWLFRFVLVSMMISDITSTWSFLCTMSPKFMKGCMFIHLKMMNILVEENDGHFP
jgi:hypothetical protein